MFRALRLPLAILLAAGLLACGQDGGPAASSTPDDGGEAVVSDFRAFLDEAYAEDMARYPLTATYRGIKTWNDQWNSVSEAFQDETRAINERRLARLQTFDRDALPADERLSWDLYKLNLERLLARDAFRHHDFVITQFRGPHTQVPSVLINIHRVKSQADAEDYIGRLERVGDYFDQVIAQLEIRTEKGLTLADWQYPQIVQSARNVITGVPYDDSGEDSTLWADFQDKVAGLALDGETRERLLAEARTALVEVVEPAYERLIAAVEAQAESAAEADGIWRFPRAEDYYATRLNWYTTTGLGADEIHEIGLAEVARIHGEMRAIMETVGFEGSLQDFFAFMRTDEQFYYPNTEAGRADYLAEARRSIDAMRERLPAYFGLLPEAEIVVKRVEPFREQSAGKAFY